MVFPLLTSGSAFWLLRLWKDWGPWPGAVSGYLLLVGPRLLLTTLSFALDLAVYHLAPGWGAERWNALLLLSGSYVTLVFYTRTFSNAIEGLLFAWLLVLVSPSTQHTGSVLKGLLQTITVIVVSTVTVTTLRPPARCWAQSRSSPVHNFCSSHNHTDRLQENISINGQQFS